MLKECIKEAVTIEEAKAACAQELAVPVEQLQTEVLQQPQKKTLGLFGGCMARVRCYFEITPSKAAVEYLEKVLSAMSVGDTAITVKEDENGCVLQLSGENLGFIIGRRGETLDSLQYLVSLVANRVDGAYYRITLDIGNYREKREHTLQDLARKIARGAAKTGRRTSLEPMNPYERRIIHTVVQDIEGATSWSVGVEPNRHVVVGPSEDNTAWKQNRKPRSSNNSRNDRNDKSDRNDHFDKRSSSTDKPPRQVREFIPRSNPMPTADGATPPVKTQSEKESTATLYGRINL